MPVGGRAGAADAADAAAPEALFERAVGAQARLIHWPLQLVGHEFGAQVSEQKVLRMILAKKGPL